MGEPTLARVGHMAASDKALRFLPRGTALVPHYEQQEAGRRRFHGWKHDPTQGPSYLDPQTKQPRHHGAYVKQSDVIAVPLSSRYLAEYLRHLREGDLWPADEATAQRAGVRFDATFGGEHAAPSAGANAPTKE